MMKNRNIKTHLSNGAHLCCGFISVLSVLFGVISVIAQGAEPANWIDSRYNRPGVHIVTNAPSPAEMAMQSNNVTVATDAKLALKIDETDGISTNLNLYSATVENKLSFSTAFTDAVADGEIAWDSDWMTFAAGLADGVTGQFFQESHIYGKNVSGQVVKNGMAVRYSGTVGNSGKCEFTLAVADPNIRPATTLGIATHDIQPGALGKITWFGNVNAIDTTGALYGETGWTDNMLVFLSTNTPGFLTKEEPKAPYPRISLGAVINAHAQSGTILVRPTWSTKVTDLNDVNGTELTESGQIMVWDNTRKVFDFTSKITDFATAVSNVYAVPVVGGKHELWVKE